MKTWKPATLLNALPPLPEFVGHWQTSTGGETMTEAFRGLARIALRRGRAALRALLGEADGAATSAAIPVPVTIPLAREARPGRAVLPMSSPARIQPNTSAIVTSRPQVASFRTERIIIGGDPDHWVVHDIKIGRHSQLADSGDLPGAVFAADADVELRLDVIETAAKFSIDVSYIGPDPGGEQFVCTAVGSTNSPASEGEDPSGRICLPLSSGVSILPGTTAMITAEPQDPFLPERIVIGKNPERWVVNDVKVGNRSQFSQAGDVPGELFGRTVRDSLVGFDTVQVGMKLEIVVTYIGHEEQGEPLLACAVGAVPR